MTTTTGVNGAAPAQDPAQDGSRLVPAKQLTPQDFLTLFLTQMKNQNPSSPMDSNAMLQQMAQISSINASTSMQQSMDNLSQTMAASLANTQELEATQLIGKKIIYPEPNGYAPLSESDGQLAGSALVTTAASDVQITIKDTNGTTVKVLDLGPAPNTGLVDFKWDGKSDDGKTTFKPGLYQVTATATVGGKPMTINTAGRFQVNSVSLNRQNNTVNLNIEDVGGIGMGDIVKIL